jgi:regulator of RNase E activity RraA
MTVTENILHKTGWQRPDPATLEAFAEHSTANLGDAMERLDIADGGIAPIWPGAKAVGSALPILTVGGDNKAVIEALDVIQPGDIVVINAQGHTDRAIMGDNLAQRFEVFGATGAIVDGAARDREIIAEMRFPVFARAVVPAGPFKNGPGRIGVPVAIGGIVVSPGDIVVADGDGMISIPQERAAEVLASAREIVALEAEKDAEAQRMRDLRV